MNNPNSPSVAGRDEKAIIRQFMDGFTIETTPKGAVKTGDFRAHLRPGTKVYVTSLPGADFAETLEACVTLAEQGMQPIPHFTARSTPDQKTLEDRLARVTSQAGVKAVLALAGADKQPAGEFGDSMSMLETGLFEKYGIESIGVAGHPEGSPDIARPLLREFGRRKLAFAETSGIDMYLITQFVFETQPVIDWIDRVRNDGNDMPVVIGLPGLASLKSLIGHAKACGVGPSMHVLTRQAKNMHKLLRLQAPSKLVRELAVYADAHPQAGIRGVHMYPLGGLAPSAAWSYATVDGNFDLTNEGFEVRD